MYHSTLFQDNVPCCVNEGMERTQGAGLPWQKKVHFCLRLLEFSHPEIRLFKGYRIGGHQFLESSQFAAYPDGIGRLVVERAGIETMKKLIEHASLGEEGMSFRDELHILDNVTDGY